MFENDPKKSHFFLKLSDHVSQSDSVNITKSIWPSQYDQVNMTKSIWPSLSNQVKTFKSILNVTKSIRPNYAMIKDEVREINEKIDFCHGRIENSTHYIFYEHLVNETLRCWHSFRFFQYIMGKGSGDEMCIKWQSWLVANGFQPFSKPFVTLFLWARLETIVP